MSTARESEASGPTVGSMPRHFGDPAAEYDAARTGAVVVERVDRRILRVAGRDPVRMLQGLITNDLAGAAASDVVYAAFLTPKGRMVAEARLLRDGASVLVETAAAAEEPLRTHLKKYVPPLFARVEDSSGLALLGVYGPAWEAMVGAVADVSARPLPPIDVPVALGRDLVVAADTLPAVRATLVEAGARPAGRSTLETLRIEAGLPRWGAELDESVIPLEAGLKERAISTSKGCYTGQEVIVRVLHRGHVNRHLRGLLLGDAPTPAAGTPLTLPGEDRAVGIVTSAAASPAMKQTIALAYVRREVQPGATVTVGDHPGLVVELPFGGPDARSA